MQTKKANQQFQLLSGMVSKLNLEQRLSLLNYLIGYLWRDEELYKGVTAWLHEQSKEEVPFTPGVVEQ